MWLFNCQTAKKSDGKIPIATRTTSDFRKNAMALWHFLTVRCSSILYRKSKVSKCQSSTTKKIIRLHIAHVHDDTEMVARETWITLDVASKTNRQRSQNGLTMDWLWTTNHALSHRSPILPIQGQSSSRKNEAELHYSSVFLKNHLPYSPVVLKFYTHFSSLFMKSFA